MPALASHRLTPLVVALATAVAALVPAPALATDAFTRAAASTTPTGGCEVPLLDQATRGSEVKAVSRDDLVAAAHVNDVAVSDLAAQVAVDRTLWLDTCGRAFHVEPAAADKADAAATDGSDGEGMSPAQAGTATDPGPLSSTLMLESNPGATRTIHLDFLGATVTNTAWNVAYSSPTITVAPYSITAPADTDFSIEELTEIQKAWQVVAEDYAPFDVNVTTRAPAAGAIERSGSADTSYGTRVLVTSGGPIYDSCFCGGVAYVDTFSLTNQHEYYQPAWVFTNGTSTYGKRLGEAASHEAGHNLGLSHDGATSAYYSGSAPWAPIMGSGYTQPVTQWSAGEYPGATNQENDLAIISTHLPVRADDHANTAVRATSLSATPLDGVISTRTDSDAFTFTGSGMTTLTAVPGPGFPDLDIGLQILDSSGSVVAYVDPPVARASSVLASGLDATWAATLPEEPATYTAIVDGVGSGDPSTPGNYSDYGSLGHYRIALVTDTPAVVDLAATSTTPVSGTVGVAYTAAPAGATGGTPPYSWAATTPLPPGLSLDSDTAAITGTPTVAGATSVTLQVTDATGISALTSFVVTVSPAPAPDLNVPDTPSGSGTPTVDVDDTPSSLAPLPAVSAKPVTITARTRTSFSAQLVAVGGTGAYTWAATGAPAGVTVSSTGLVAGSVTLPGARSFPVTVTSGPQSTVITLTLTVVRRRSFMFATPKRLPSGHIDRSYAATIATRGSEGRVTWKQSGSTPPGLRMVRRKSGRVTVSGRSTRAGTYVFTLVAIDAIGVRRARRFTLRINR